MKVILTGSTGFVGTEVLHQALQNPAITSIVVLSRKQLPESVTKSPKATVRIIDDFLSYPESLLQDLRGAEACLWSLGIASAMDMDMYRRVNIEYTMAAVSAFTEHLSPYTGGKPFRFIYCSGFAAVRDQDKTLWALPQMRRIRGQIENRLLEFGQENKGKVDIWILRPAMIVSKQLPLRSLVLSLPLSIGLDAFAGLMLGLGIDGSTREERILENSDMRRWTAQ